MKQSRFQIEIDDVANCIFARHFGVVDLPIMLERREATLKHKGYRSGLNRITEFTNVEVLLNSEDIRVITEKVSLKINQSGNYREVFIVDNLLGFGLGRVFHTLSTENMNEYEILSIENPNLSEKIKGWLSLDSEYIFPDFLSIGKKI